MSPRLLRMAIRVDREAREEAVAALLALAPQGFEEVDRGDEVELAVYADSAAQAELRAALERMRGATRATVEPVEEGWEDAWRAFHQPVRAGGLWIGPPWLYAPEGEPSVVVDPGRAFGTGAHPTTRLCVELLSRVETRGSLLDVGCGSGVLAVAGVRLGFAPVSAVDDDPVAVEVTRATAAANGADVAAAVADALRDPLLHADVAVANVLLRPVEQILVRIDAGVAITSGYLADERPAHDGWRHVETVELDGWAADRFDRA